ncbi:MAG: hypothetical protein N4A57_18095 [Anaeromicrobium sp.]|jgi:hypothetical protein|uniref:hypothetical protein n=1 Tax=Anaeromicrobium sp. TaxID=1929132 RepID=UPI0025D78D2E|nr:hypothetical protein [Anaeromicrobium sp.]MCT4596162.1 hypothetical protein [Anaeromicrobium sp.]
MKGFAYVNLIVILGIVMIITGVVITVNLHDNMTVQLQCDYYKAKYLAESGIEEISDKIYDDINAYINSYFLRTKMHKLEYINKQEKEYTPLDVHKYINKPFVEGIYNYNYKKDNIFKYVHNHKYNIKTTYEPKYNRVIIESEGTYNKSKSKIQILMDLAKLEVNHYDENNLPIVKIKSPEIIEYKYIY